MRQKLRYHIPNFVELFFVLAFITVRKNFKGLYLICSFLIIMSVLRKSLIWKPFIVYEAVIKAKCQTSLVLQWLRIHLPMWGTWPWSLIQEDSIWHRPTKPMPHKYWACTLEFMLCKQECCAQSLQPYTTLCNPMDCSPPGFSVHGILHARILEWVATPSSRDLLNPGIEPASLKPPALAGRSFTTIATWEAQEKPMLCH